MTRYKLKVTWIKGFGSEAHESETVPFLNRRIAERRAKAWREIALVSKVEVVAAEAV